MSHWVTTPPPALTRVTLATKTECTSPHCDQLDRQRLQLPARPVVRSTGDSLNDLRDVVDEGEPHDIDSEAELSHGLDPGHTEDGEAAGLLLGLGAWPEAASLRGHDLNTRMLQCYSLVLLEPLSPGYPDPSDIVIIDN